MKGIFVLGATGSIGTRTLDIIRERKDKFKLVGLAMGRNLELGKKLIEEFKPEIICTQDKVSMGLSYCPSMVHGDSGLEELCSYKSEFDENICVNALVGMAGLVPTVKAIESGKDIALANKETLVVAGDIIKSLVKKHGVKLIPIDSEHSAILECLQGEDPKEVRRLIITASGGSFRDKTREELAGVTKEQALAHPNWKMGSKITIDSSTMMNKGFEVIEAHYLFDMPYEKIETVMHRESVIHSMVEFNDGVIKASLGTPDMHIPIAYALEYPEHKYSGSVKYLDFTKMTLNFEELSKKRFPCLGFAYEAQERGGVYLSVLNASNECAVNLFLDDKIKYLEIEDIIRENIYSNEYENIPYTLENVIETGKSVMKKIYNKYGK